MNEFMNYLADSPVSFYAVENLKAESARQKKKDEGGEDAFDLIARRRQEVKK